MTVPASFDRLDPEQRRRVTRAVGGGQRIDDPELAPAVVALARRQRASFVLMLISGMLAIAITISDLASGTRRAGAAFDMAVVVFWFVLAPFLLRSLLRARRAIAANGPGAG